MLESINILRFIAAVLIVNSHMDSIYPISSFATGGAIGNAVFFAVSGYCLANIKQPFIDWYKKRVLRLYPKVFAVTLILIAINYIIIRNPIELLYYFLYPTYYWFIGAIALFYIIFYLLYYKGYNKTLNYTFVILMCFIYVINYIFIIDTSVWSVEEDIICKYIFYFLIMMMGAYIKNNNDTIGKNSRYIIKLIVFILIYFGFKFTIDIHPYIMKFQFLTQLFTFPIVYYLFKLLLKNEDKLIKKGRRLKNIALVIVNYISKLTLEIYLVHIPVLKYIPDICFPLNFILFVIVTVILAAFLQKVIECVNSFIKKWRQ